MCGLACVGGIASSAYFHAFGLTQLMSGAGTLPSFARTAVAGAPSPLPLPAKTSASSVLPHHEALAPSLRDAPECPGFELSIVSEAPDAYASLASVRRAGDSRGRLLREGSRFGELALVHIGYDARSAAPLVWFRQNDELCQLRLFSRPRPGQPVSREELVVVERAPDRWQNQIRSLGPHSFQVDRAFVERLLQDPATPREAQAVLRTVDGRVVGFELRRLRPGGWASALGLQVGDRLTKINGYDLTSPARAIQAYAVLRRAKTLDITRERAGQRETIHVEISD
jgi:general secretion pathway protein C